jgi:hypothetical protein
LDTERECTELSVSVLIEFTELSVSVLIEFTELSVSVLIEFTDPCKWYSVLLRYLTYVNVF